MSSPLRLAALASGRGSNVRALLDAIDRDDLHAQMAVIIANNSKAGVLELARAREIPYLHISRVTHADEGQALLEALQKHAVDLVVLAGYMKKLDPRVVEAFRNRAINIHPGPLPRFGGQGMFGHHVHQAVLDTGVSETGPTVHRVTAEYDEGETLAFRPVPVLSGDSADTLAARVLAAEHDLYWRVIENRFVRPQKRV